MVQPFVELCREVRKERSKAQAHCLPTRMAQASVAEIDGPIEAAIVAVVDPMRLDRGAQKLGFDGALIAKSAYDAPGLAKVLEAEIRKIPQVRIVWKVEANGVFAQIPQHAIEKIQQRYFFYPWIEEECIVRWMCSFDTTAEDVGEFASCVAEAVTR